MSVPPESFSSNHQNGGNHGSNHDRDSVSSPLPPLAQSGKDLASWVNQVRQRDTSISSAIHPPSSINPTGFLPSSSVFPSRTTPASVSSSAAQLENDFQNQRRERQNRRSRLSLSGIKAISHPPSASSTPTPPSMDSSSSSSAPRVKRANTVLARYGGQSGPTGIAAGPKGSADTPVSLASFMGGKASGPRLGKLAGDGKSAPPEAELIHESRRVALPGLANPNPTASTGGGGRPLASFLEQRANKLGGSPVRNNSAPPAPLDFSSIRTTPSIPPSTNNPLLSPNRSSANFSQYRSMQKHLEPEISTDAVPSSPVLGLSSSPRKAYLDLIEKQNKNNTPSSPILRSPSPSKLWRDTPQETERPPSPLKLTRSSSYLASAPSTSPAKVSSYLASMPGTSPVKVPSTAGFASRTLSRDLPASPRKDASTSPLKPTDLLHAKTVVLPSASKSLGVANDSYTSSVAPSTSPRKESLFNSDISSPLAASISQSSISSTTLSSADRLPTASLSRLSSKKMVVQRIREAQQRDAIAQKESVTMQTAATAASPTRPVLAGGIRDRWPHTGLSTASQTTATPPSLALDQEKKNLGGWSPPKFGNAFPGLAGQSPSRANPSSSFTNQRFGSSGSPPKRAHESGDAMAEPVRLPGLGASTSPFKRFSPTKEEAPIVQSAIQSGNVLQPLTKSRARGPVRRGQTTSATLATTNRATVEPSSPKKISTGFSLPSRSEQIKAPISQPVAAESKSAVGLTATPSSKLPRRTTGKRIHVLVSGSGSNLQALIDATLLNPASGSPVIPDAHIAFVLSNRKAAYGLTRAKESNPSIPTKVLALKTWQNQNPGGSREQYDQVLARAVLDGAHEEGKGTPPDLIVLAGFMHIVSEGFLHALGHKTSLPESLPTIGRRPSKPVPIINLHPALPGAFDGANAIPRAFEAYQNGLVEKTGCMIHEVVADVDRGRPIIVHDIFIQPSWNLERLEEEIHKVEHVIIVQGAAKVLQGCLEEMDREAEAEMAKKQRQQRKTTESRAKRVDARELVRIGSKQNGTDAVKKAELMLRSFTPIKSQDFTSLTRKNIATGSKCLGSKTISVEVFSVHSDGSMDRIHTDLHRNEMIGHQEFVYQDETLVVVHRFKTMHGQAETELWVRAGSKSPLHPLQQELSQGPAFAGREAAKIADFAQRYGAKATVVPVGFEDSDLIECLGGRWTVARQGSRRHFDPDATGLYRVRTSLPGSDGKIAAAMTIDQIDLDTANLCSGDSFVVCILSSYLIWHGRGSSKRCKAAAHVFVHALQKEAGVSTTNDSTVSEYDEGHEDTFFWSIFDRKIAYASSWYHRRSCSSIFNRQENEIKPHVVHMHDVEFGGNNDRNVVIQSVFENGQFGLADLVSPARQDKISMLNLGNKELFVVIGKNARSNKSLIAFASLLAQSLALSIQQDLKKNKPAVHVLILPSKIPKEIRSAARYWSDDAEIQSQNSVVKMNLVVVREALQQLNRDGGIAFPRWMIQDPNHLPVGIGREDVFGV